MLASLKSKCMQTLLIVRQMKRAVVGSLSAASFDCLRFFRLKELKFFADGRKEWRNASMRYCCRV